MRCLRVSRVAPAIVLASLATLGGCSAFQNRTVMHPIAEEPLADGSQVVLWEVLEVGPFSRLSTFGLSRDTTQTRWVLEETPPGGESGDKRFALRTHPTDLKAWVIDKQTGSVVLSMDYENDVVRCDPQSQPEWALPAER
jgi:hypothetical protein